MSSRPLPEDLAHLLGHRSLDLEPDRIAESAATQLLLDRDEEVVGVVLVEGQVSVPGHAEEVVPEDLHAREQEVEVRPDHLVEERVPMAADRLALAPRELDEAGQDGGHLHPREPALVRCGIAERHGHGQGQGRDVGERVARIDGEGRQDRVDLGEELLAQRGVMLRHLGVVDDLDALASEQTPQLPVDAGLLARRGR